LVWQCGTRRGKSPMPKYPSLTIATHEYVVALTFSTRRATDPTELDEHLQDVAGGESYQSAPCTSVAFSVLALGGTIIDASQFGKYSFISFAEMR
jgi:hypothetical protein